MDITYVDVLSKIHASYICICVIASRKSRVSARLLCRWNIIFNISRVSLREFGPLINFEPLCTVLNGNCQASAIAREKLSCVVATSISARAKTNRNPAIYPDATLIWRNCPVASNYSRLILWRGRAQIARKHFSVEPTNLVRGYVGKVRAPWRYCRLVRSGARERWFGRLYDIIKEITWEKERERMDGCAYRPIRFRQLSATTSLKLTVGLAVEWMPFIMNVIACPISTTLPASFELLSFLRFSVGSSPTSSFSSEASSRAIGMKEQARVYVIKRMKRKKTIRLYAIQRVKRERQGCDGYYRSTERTSLVPDRGIYHV